MKRGDNNFKKSREKCLLDQVKKIHWATSNCIFFVNSISSYERYSLSFSFQITAEHYEYNDDDDNDDTDANNEHNPPDVIIINTARTPSGGWSCY